MDKNGVTIKFVMQWEKRFFFQYLLVDIIVENQKINREAIKITKIK